MNDELLKLITTTLNAVSANFAQDAQRIQQVLPSLSGVGYSNSGLLSSVGGMLEMYFRQQYINRQGPTATMLRQRARVGSRLMERHVPGAVLYEGPQRYGLTLDDNRTKVEEAIAYLSPFRAEQPISALESVLGKLLAPYLPSASKAPNAPANMPHQGFNMFKVQPLQFGLDRKASPCGRIDREVVSDSRHGAVDSYKMQLLLQDAGGSRRSLSFTVASTNSVYSLSNSVYDALEDVTYRGDGAHYTEEQLRECVETVFTAAGWSKEEAEKDEWSAEQWSKAFRGVRYVGSEPEPLTDSIEAQRLAEMRYGGRRYCEWVNEEGSLCWRMNGYDMCFTGTLHADGTPEAPNIVLVDRYGEFEGPWTIRPRCLPDLLDTLMEQRALYLEKLRRYQEEKNSPSLDDDDD